MASILGLDCKAYYLSTGTRESWDGSTPAPAALTEITVIRDVTLNLSRSESDVTTRGSNGWRQTLTTLKEGEVTFQIVWDTEDASFTAIRNAWLNGTTLAAAFLTGAKDEAGAEGLYADFNVANFTRNEGLEEGVTVDVSLRVAYSAVAPNWVEVTT